MKNEKHIRVIEVEGHKFEIDTRTAKRIDQFRVGDRVKVLTKDYSGYKTHPGAIVGIDCFQKLPTVVVAYIDDCFNDAGGLKFAYMNSQAKDVEICPMAEDDVLPNRETIRMHFDRSIGKKMLEVEALQEKKEFFLRMYGVTVGASMKPAEAAAVEEPYDPDYDSFDL
jgi:hypothetical protein